MSETMESTRAVRSSGSRWLVPCSITRARCRSIRPSDNSTTGSGALLVFDEVVTARLAHGRRRPRRRGPLLDITATVDRWFEAPGFWMRPPQSLIDCVQASNVSVFTVDETWAFRLDHQVRHLFRTGPGGAVFKVDLATGKWSLTREDMEPATERGKVLMSSFEGARLVHVTTPGGTDLHLSVEGRPCLPVIPIPGRGDRKSTRLNSSHVRISYAVFCLKKKNKIKNTLT